MVKITQIGCFDRATCVYNSLQRIYRFMRRSIMNKKLTISVTAAMLAALTCIATMVIKVPTIGTNGYVNIGDSVVLLSMWILGNPYGALAAGIGSGLADLISGYGSYVPGTTVIKFAMAFAGYLVYKAMTSGKIPKTAAYIVSSLVAEVIMVVGYFLYEATFLGYGVAAAASIPSNMVQGITCLVLGNLLIQALSRVPYINGLMVEKR